jgi:hypothetical protein
MRGVKLGLFSETTALEKFEVWNASHEKLVAEREIAHKKHKAANVIQPIIKKVEAVAETPVVEEAPAAETPAVEETPVVEENPAVEEAPVAETPAEETPSAE